MRARATILAWIAVMAGMIAAPTASAAEQLAVGDDNRLQLVNPDGSRAKTLAKVRATETIDDVVGSRDGKHVAYVVRSADARRRGLFIVRRSGRDEERLARGAADYPDFSRNEEVVARINGDVMRLDADGRGSDRVLRESRLSVEEIEVTRGGRIALFGSRGDNGYGIFSIRRSGRGLKRIASQGVFFCCDFNLLSVPRETGAPVTFTRQDSIGGGVFDSGIASVNPGGSSRRDLSPGRSDDGEPEFSDNGERIVYVTDDERSIETMAADGSDRRPVVSAPPPPPGFFETVLRSPRMSPRQSHLAFLQVDVEGRFSDLFLVRIAKIDGSGQVVAAGPVVSDEGQSFDWLP